MWLITMTYHHDDCSFNVVTGRHPAVWLRDEIKDAKTTNGKIPILLFAMEIPSIVNHAARELELAIDEVY